MHPVGLSNCHLICYTISQISSVACSSFSTHTDIKCKVDISVSKIHHFVQGVGLLNE